MKNPPKYIKIQSPSKSLVQKLNEFKHVHGIWGGVSGSASQSEVIKFILNDYMNDESNFVRCPNCSAVLVFASALPSGTGFLDCYKCKRTTKFVNETGSLPEIKLMSKRGLLEEATNQIDRQSEKLVNPTKDEMEQLKDQWFKLVKEAKKNRVVSLGNRTFTLKYDNQIKAVFAISSDNSEYNFFVDQSDFFTDSALILYESIQ